MKVIQALARYFPDKCGGIQVKLNDLLPKLRQGIKQSRTLDMQAADLIDIYNKLQQ